MNSLLRWKNLDNLDVNLLFCIPITPQGVELALRSNPRTLSIAPPPQTTTLRGPAPYVISRICSPKHASYFRSRVPMVGNAYNRNGWKPILWTLISWLKKVFFAWTLSIGLISSALSTDSVRFPKFLVVVEKWDVIFGGMSFKWLGNLWPGWRMATKALNAHPSKMMKKRSLVLQVPLYSSNPRLMLWFVELFKKAFWWAVSPNVVHVSISHRSMRKYEWDFVTKLVPKGHSSDNSWR